MKGRLPAVCIALLAFVIVARASTLDELEQQIAGEMRAIIALKVEIRAARSEANELERKVAETKRSGSLIDRMMLGRQLEKLHQILAENDRREEQAQARRKRVDRYHRDALKLIAEQPAEEAASLRDHFDLISFHEIERLIRLMREARRDFARAETDEKKEALEREFRRLKDLRAARFKEFRKYYGVEVPEP